MRAEAESALGTATSAAKKIPGKPVTERFDDIPVEGVEAEDQLDWLRAEGCNEVQGFLFSAARPAAEIAKLLAEFGRRASRAA